MRDASLDYPHVPTLLTHDRFWWGVWGAPLTLFALAQLLRPRRARCWAELHHALLALTQAFSLASTFKHGLEHLGRLRPDWLARLASGDERAIADGRSSYPSGKVVYSFAAAGVMALFLLGRTRVLAASRPGQFPALLLCLAPVGLATAVAAERVASYHHAFDDTLAGGLIGACCAALCYLALFHPPWDAARAGAPKLRSGVSQQVARCCCTRGCGRCACCGGDDDDGGGTLRDPLLGGGGGGADDDGA